jgi:tetratricopeptide (TPR) repeat protein
MSIRLQLNELLGAQRWDEAEALCERELARGGDAFFQLTLARLATVRGDKMLALRHLRPYVSHAVEAADLTMAGDLYVELGLWKHAVRLYQEALRRDPRAITPHCRLFDVYRRQDDRPAAEPHLEAVLATRLPSAWARREKAGLLFEDGDWDGALRFYETLTDAFSRHAVGEIRARRDELAAAEKAYREAIAAGPPTPWPHYRLANLLRRHGQPQAALALMQQAPHAGLYGLEEFMGRLRRDQAPEPYASRLREMRAGRCVLHQYKGRETWSRIRLRVVVYGRPFDGVASLLSALKTFHAEQFGDAAPIDVVSMIERSGSQPYDYFENAIKNENFRPMCAELGVTRRRPGEAVLVLLMPPQDPPLARGVGGYGYAAIECARRDVYLSAVAAHELYHAVLALLHTDGDMDFLEAGGIMGWPGGQNRLEDSYVAWRHQAQCATPRAAARHIRLGWRADEDGNWDDAAAHYGEAVRLDPLHLWGASRWGHIELHRGHYARSAAILERLVALDASVEYVAQLAHVQLDRGRYREARRLFESSRGYGRDARTHLLVAFAWARSWYYRQARREYHQALALKPHHLQALGSLAAVEHALGRHDKARRLYTGALERDPHWAEIYVRRGLLFAEMGEWKAAERDLRRAGGLKPGEAELYQARARLRARQGRWAEVPVLLGRARDDEPHTPSAVLWLGWAQLLSGDEAAARESWRQCAGLEVRSPMARVAAAWLAALNGEPGGSHLPWLRRLHRRDPRVAPLAHVLSLMEFAAGNEAAAREALHTLRTLEPALPWQRRLDSFRLNGPR